MIQLSFLLIIGCSKVDAEDTTENGPIPVEQQVEQITDQVEDQSNVLDAIEHYLLDKELVRAGKAPKDWVQPELSAYEAPDAPKSFIPTETSCPPTVSEPEPNPKK